MKKYFTENPPFLISLHILMGNSEKINFRKNTKILLEMVYYLDLSYCSSNNLPNLILVKAQKSQPILPTDISPSPSSSSSSSCVLDDPVIKTKEKLQNLVRRNS